MRTTSSNRPAAAGVMPSGAGAVRLWSGRRVSFRAERLWSRGRVSFRAEAPKAPQSRNRRDTGRETPRSGPLRFDSAVVMLAAFATVAIGCPGERRDRAGDSARAAVPVDTTPMDLSKVETSLPPAAPDTFQAPTRRVARRSGGEVAPPIPPAPPALMEAVSREQAFSRFCYQEFGQKVDPTLSGGVAVVVTVGQSGVTDAEVANDSWSSKAGAAVNRCLNQRAASAWKLGAGAVPAGKYVVRMTFPRQ